MRPLLTTIFIFSLLSSAISKPLDAPVITCIDVLENGEVTIYWRSLDPTALEFRIFYSTDNISWFQAGSVESQNLDMQYTIGNQWVNANEQMYYFYITAVYPSADVDSEVYNTMFLVVDNSSDGLATLLWNSLGNPPPQGTIDGYELFVSVYEEGNPMQWNSVANNISNTLYNYTIPNGICFDSLNFKVEIENNYDCKSTSNITGNWFSETIQPEKPIFDSVSILNNEFAILGWTPSTSEDALGTVIYRYESGIWVIIDTVMGNTNSQYIDISYNACGSNIEYAIASIDSCKILSPGSFQKPLRPILLKNVNYDICSATNSLSWEPYINAEPNVQFYEIWTSVNGNPFELVQSIDGNETTFNHVNVQNGSDYIYFVRSIFGTLTSTSCQQEIKTGNYSPPSDLYLANSSVMTDNTIELVIDIDITPNSCVWEIWRSEPNSINMAQLFSFNRSDINSTPYFFSDEEANASLGFYNYRVDVYDSCNNLSIESNRQKTIYLTGNYISKTKNQLTWNNFEGYDSGLEKYFIWRYTANSANAIIIDSVDYNVTEFTDDISSISAEETVINYWIQGKENGLNNYGYNEKSNSNHISFFRETEFYMPNAFRPNGINTSFKPVTTSFGGTNYKFQIYNRWGQLVFETTDPTEGWDGTYNGKPYAVGSYVYLLAYESVFGQEVLKQGTVTLID
ncbi:MAG: gliding motility-associated C-terminal domain-containing protein [Bacteroidales bacterium]|nr:gliding motility-associated C-terminal domain-containing protein [Bacteroidales bacterium]MDG1901070.1 gliding motility-associated C-terminal domain-containing protein [Bacteroidales bacterium]MDG2080699.1 gliding motility-associated C-terminal domain-containing protein [Bacteroidales bacterium]